jgi:hypothetical protein
MKSWRLWLLVLMAVLIPVRGAVAAAMLCPVAAPGARTELAMAGHSAGHAVMHKAMDESMSHHHAVGHDDANGHHQHAAAASVDSLADPEHAASEACNVCSAFCSLTPLLSKLPTLAEPLGPSTVKFRDLSAPAPSFLSDGQERPPRTI